MRSANFVKLSGLILLMTVLALSGAGTFYVEAGLPAQSTPAATAPAGTPAAVCPPVQALIAARATAAATMAVTADATVAATPGAITNPGYLGITGESRLDGCGAVITRVLPNTPASQAGLRVDDVIVAVDIMEVRSLEGLRDYIRTRRKPGDQIVLVVRRNNVEQPPFTITLAEVPPAETPVAPSTAAPTTSR